MVKWFKLRPSGDDVEVSGCCPRVSCRVGSGGLDVGPLGSRPPILSQLIGEEEDVSVYDIADHPDFRFRTTDIVIRIGNTEDGGPHREDEVRAPWPVRQLQYNILVCYRSCLAFFCYSETSDSYSSPSRNVIIF